MSIEIGLTCDRQVNSVHDLVELDFPECKVIFSSFTVQALSSITQSYFHMNFTSAYP